MAKFEIRTKRWIVGGVIAACIACPRSGSSCIGDQFDSVHFHSGQPDFGRVPRRARVWEADDRSVGEHNSGGGRVGVELEEESDREVVREQNRLRGLKLAEALLNSRQWRLALNAYRQALARFGPNGSVRDRVEVLQKHLSSRKPAPHMVELLLAYSHATNIAADPKAFDAPKSIKVLSGIAGNSRAGFLREHALYQWATLEYQLRHYADAVALYQRQVREFPRSTKTEAGLIMLARCAILPAERPAPIVNAGIVALNILDRRFPRSRFRRSAIGLRGKALFLEAKYRQALDCYLSVGDMGSVEIVRKAMPRGAGRPDLLARLMAGYLRRLATANSYNRYAVTIHDIDRTRAEFNPFDADRFSQLLRSDMSLPAPYFYYRLYHTETKPKEIAHLASLANRIARAHPGVRLPALVQVRFGEVAYFQKRYREAERWCNSALAADRRRSEATPRALYVRGASLEKTGRRRPAQADFQKLLHDYPGSPLRRGAREELAILHEALGNLAGALDQYVALGYQADIAFFLDGRMSTEQVEEYLRSRPDRRYTNIAIERWDTRRPKDIPRELHTHALIRYVLGIRYMRSAQWDRAARLMRQFPVETYFIFSRGRREWDGKPSPDPLTVARSLGQLQRSIGAARTGDDKAAAMYRYATYYYTHGTLLLYAPPLWQGEREVHFQFYWNDRHATLDDKREMDRYMHEHEVYAHAMKVYQEIARRFPKSPYAPKALYRAACSAYHQSNLNEWWRERDKDFGYQARASHLMAALARRYPKHPLAIEAKKYAGVFSLARSAY